MDQKHVNVPVGRIAIILNALRDIYSQTSFGFFYLTNECNYSCKMCYMDSRPGMMDTRIGLELSLELMQELKGIDEIILSGGELTLLAHHEKQLRAACSAARLVAVYTNGTGFINKTEISKFLTKSERGAWREI